MTDRTDVSKILFLKIDICEIQGQMYQLQINETTKKQIIDDYVKVPKLEQSLKDALQTSGEITTDVHNLEMVLDAADYQIKDLTKENKQLKWKLAKVVEMGTEILSGNISEKEFYDELKILDEESEGEK